MSSDPQNKSFEFTFSGIGSVLKLNRLKVPPHQREYSWTDDKVDQLISDFADAKATNRDHFLGTIVTIDEKGDNTLNIVDGQQRLTTTAIFLAEVRNFLKQIDGAGIIIESIDNEFLSVIDRKSRERKPRLSLNTDDNDFFKQLIEFGSGHPELKPTTESHDLLLEAALTAKKWVKIISQSFAEKDVVDRLNDWIEYLENRATIVLLKVADSSQAFKMFETLNDRGLRTSQADLVKSYLFGEASSRVAEAQARWSSMRENLHDIKDGDRLINFLRHSFIATKKFSRTEEVYENTQAMVRGESNALEYLGEMERLSKAYVATFHADSQFWDGYSKKAKTAINIFNRFDPKPVRPLFLSIALKFGPAQFEKAMQLLVCLAVRSTVTGKNRSGTVEVTYANAASSVYNEKVLDISGLQTALLNVTVLDSEFRAAFSTARSTKADYARYYLRALEAVKNSDKEPWYVVNDDATEITLEHILPKNPDREKWPAFSEEDRRRYANRIGNLCLLQKTPNSNAKNISFPEKKNIYVASPLSLTSEIGISDDWTTKKIEDRQEMMSELALKAWPV